MAVKIHRIVLSLGSKSIEMLVEGEACETAIAPAIEPKETTPDGPTMFMIYQAYGSYLLGSGLKPSLPASVGAAHRQLCCVDGCSTPAGTRRKSSLPSSPCWICRPVQGFTSSPATMARASGRAAGQPPADSVVTKPASSADWRPLYFAAFLLLADAALVALIIAFVPYTKIDWDAYMSQVDAFLEGERDYTKIEGDTGPLVYPAGFLYVYSAIKFITSGQVFPAQILFGVLYIVNLSLVLLLYVKTEALPWWALGLLCLSKRVHSIFVLRLFNDCVAMTLLHAAMVFIVYHKWYLGLIVFSGAVSIKMNVLLFAPSLFLLMLKAMSIKGVFLALLGAAIVQVLLGMPFLLLFPVQYISRAFNLGRVFIHFWSVNFKFVPEKLFVSKELAVALLILHLTTLVIFAHYKWLKHEGGLIGFMHMRFRSAKSIQQFISCKPGLPDLSKEHIVTVMFVGNFIGILCARSLHYQFYSWYFYSLPFLLWKTRFPTALKIILFAGVELCWNIYPSTAYSSLLLLFLHVAILFGIWISPTEYPYVKRRT